MAEPKSVAGLFASLGTVADRMHDGSHAEGEIVDVTCLKWEWDVEDISSDWYDNSLEVYFEDHIVDLEPTAEQLEQIWTFGFSQCWLNFKGGKGKDGTERHYVNIELRDAMAAKNAQPNASASALSTDSE